MFENFSLFGRVQGSIGVRPRSVWVGFIPGSTEGRRVS